MNCATRGVRYLEGDADRRKPRWAKPLAPLPDWLASVDHLLQESLYRQGDPRLSLPASSLVCHFSDSDMKQRRKKRAKWLKAFRRRLGLTQAAAARELGYRRKDIGRIESGSRVRIPAKLQQQLAESKRPGAFENRASWILDWRQRMGISQRGACRLLGYFGENAIGHIKYGHFQPSWQKILIAILEEERGSALERRTI